ncbi:MAG: hypothetical protein ACL93V_14325 [Candidatus Electrothrix sp. YB6]
MQEKFLLYIDILGFSDLIKSEERTKDLYKIIDSLNVHSHDVFQTIVFSDTILVYNKETHSDEDSAKYIVWYATEFAEDLHFRLIGKGLYFRAVLTYGEFEHYHLKNTECFFGKALVDSYNSEKNIQTTGLLIDNECHKYLRFFASEKFDNNWHFIYLERSFKYLDEMMFEGLPIRREVFMEGENVPFLLEALEFIKDIYGNMRNHPVPTIRTKYLTTWDFYHRKYSVILDYLIGNNFSPESVCPNFNWEPLLKRFENKT